MNGTVRHASALLVGLALLSAGCTTCPMNVFLSPGKRAFNSLQNRTTPPSAGDFDPRVTLEGMLAPGRCTQSRESSFQIGAAKSFVGVNHATEAPPH